MYWFQSNKPVNTASELQTGQRSSSRPGRLTLEEFKSALFHVLQTRSFENQLESLFTKLDVTSDGCVDWNEFCTYILVQLKENDYISKKKQLPFQSEPRIRHIFRSQQETTSKIFSAGNPTKYITVSKEGVMCVWTIGLHEEKCYYVFEDNNRHVREWVTDAVYLPNCHRIAIASTGRDIRFFDTTTSTQYCEEFCLYALPNVPCCCDYWYDKENVNGSALLIYGDDHGAIHILQFLKPNVQLFAIPFNKDEGVQRVYFPELSLHDQYVVHTQLEYSHSEPIRSLQYFPDSNSIAIATTSSSNSLVITDVRNRKKCYSFNISKGVECFDYNKNSTFSSLVVQII
jgi:WD40 repeat protein